MTKKKKILITGGAGFIATHLSRQLLAHDYQVTSLDLVEPRNPVRGVKYIQGDVRDTALLDTLLDDVDAVYHFAAVVSVPMCEQKPHESATTNLFSTHGLLELLRQKNEKRPDRKILLVFAGTSAVYGNTCGPSEAIQEDKQLVDPVSFYALQKLGSEQAIRLYHKNFGIPAVVFRFFNVYGQGQDPTSPYSGVITIFRNNIAHNKPLMLHDGGSRTRDFISVTDLARACAQAIDLDPSACTGEPINLGTSVSVTIRSLAEVLVDVTQSQVKLEAVPARPGDVHHSRANITRAETLLGWKPAISLQQGLQDLINGS